MLKIIIEGGTREGKTTLAIAISQYLQYIHGLDVEVVDDDTPTHPAEYLGLFVPAVRNGLRQRNESITIETRNTPPVLHIGQDNAAQRKVGGPLPATLTAEERSDEDRLLRG